jgi:hypothetical protein
MVQPIWLSQQVGVDQTGTLAEEDEVILFLVSWLEGRCSHCSKILVNTSMLDFQDPWMEHQRAKHGNDRYLKPLLTLSNKTSP